MSGGEMKNIFNCEELELILYSLKLCHAIELERSSLLRQDYTILDCLEKTYSGVISKIDRQLQMGRK